mgnify:CR=1 FL=1
MTFGRLLTEFKEKLSPKFPQTRWGADIVALIFPDKTVLVSTALARDVVPGRRPEGVDLQCTTYAGSASVAAAKGLDALCTRCCLYSSVGGSENPA